MALARSADGSKARPKNVEISADLRHGVDQSSAIVTAMQRIDTTGRPRRGTTLWPRRPAGDARMPTRGPRSQSWATDSITDAVTPLGNGESSAPAGDRGRFWIHGDLHAGNLLLITASSAVLTSAAWAWAIACDFMPRGTLFSHESESAKHLRAAYPSMKQLGAKPWLAISKSLIALP